MKNYPFGFLAIAIAVSFAFTEKWETRSKDFATTYFHFVGDENADYFVASGWEARSFAPYDQCPGTNYTCTVSSSSFSTPAQIATFLCNTGLPKNPHVSEGTIYYVLSRKHFIDGED